MRKIAIACQGGGSHTAFTAGVLKTIVRSGRDRFEIAGLSGTSGGAICAALAWYGLVAEGPEKAVELLDSFWEENSARTPWDAYLNLCAVWGARYGGGAALPEIAASSAWFSFPGLPAVSDWAQNRLKSMLESLIDFDRLSGLDLENAPDLYIAAANVSKGKFRVFDKSDLAVESILASAAIPTIFKGVRIGDAVYWDGLFSQNPPIRDFLTRKDRDEKPDEIWIVQVNPAERKREPVAASEILDRRNELAGNLSLTQELEFVETVNGWLAEAEKSPNSFLAERYKMILPRTIRLEKDCDHPSKLDRRPAFIKELMESGEKEAEKFLKSM